MERLPVKSNTPTINAQKLIKTARNPSGIGLGGGTKRVGLTSPKPLSKRRKLPNRTLIVNIAHKVAGPPQPSGSPLSPKCTGMRAGKVGITRKVQPICNSQVMNNNSFSRKARRFGTIFIQTTNIASAMRPSNMAFIFSSYLHGPTETL